MLEQELLHGNADEQCAAKKTLSYLKRNAGAEAKKMAGQLESAYDEARNALMTMGADDKREPKRYV